VSYVYFIGPARTDPQYPEKRRMLADIARMGGYQFFFPLERHMSFSFDSMRSDLRKARAVIADLSLERPSCYFEVGVAQALDLPVKMIAASGTPIHQTATPSDVNFYSDLAEFDLIIRRTLASPELISRGSPGGA
jgi:nucleoside 2-deoxyribosyltransferase